MWWRSLAGPLGTAIWLCSFVPPAQAQSPLLIPPVDGAVARHFDAPATDYGAGHRGIDYTVAGGTPVRAAAGGEVTFAGPVARSRAVSVRHRGDVTTTYSVLDEIYVSEGDVVGQGHWLGTAGAAHPGGPGGLHFGVKVGARYADPADFLGALDLGRALHLAPLTETYEDAVGARELAMLPYRHIQRCAPPHALMDRPSPPNDNVVVMVAGIASETVRGRLPEIYGSYATSAFGYPPGRVYDFSYRGNSGPRLHEPYTRSDTYADLGGATLRLRALLERIARRHPGRDVDIVAHSQGGILARALLVKLARSWEQELPRVEHVVTLASPHRGSPVAAVAEASSPAGHVARALWRAAARLLPIPPPGARALAQLGPDSPLLQELAAEDVAFGARLLALTTPHDLVVPADKATVSHEVAAAVPAGGVWGHSSIVRARATRAVAYSFLRDASSPCPGIWDLLAPVVGRAVSHLWGKVGRILGR